MLDTPMSELKRLDGTVRKDKMLVNETEWPPMIAGRRSYGKYRQKYNLRKKECRKEIRMILI